MGFEYAERGHRRRKQREVEGGRLMLRGLLRLMVVFVVLWVIVAAIGLTVGHPPDGHGGPAQHERHR